MKKKNKGPLSFEEFVRLGTFLEFKNIYHVPLDDWNDVLGEDEAWMDEEDDGQYKRYLNWYSRTFTKLGKVLE